MPRPSKKRLELCKQKTTEDLIKDVQNLMTKTRLSTLSEIPSTADRLSKLDKNTRVSIEEASLKREIYRLLCLGYTHSQIQDLYIIDHFGFNTTMNLKSLDNLIKHCQQELVSNYDSAVLEEWKPKLLNSLYDLYRECRRTEDLTNALKVLKEIGMMVGAYSQIVDTTKTVNNNVVSISFGFGDEQVPFDEIVENTEIPDKETIEDIL